MKPKSLFVILIALLLGCSKEEEVKRGREAHEEIPDEIIPSKPCTTLYKSIMDMFYEHQNNQTQYPQLFANGAMKSVVLTKESELYVTFISEGAGYENSLGYYTYNENDGPGGKSSDLELHILFPHISSSVLTKGDMLQVGTGKFPKGTVVGFFLVIRGWEEDGFVNYDKPIHFTDYDFNINHHQQHILFKEGTCGDIVMAFEDKPLDSGSDYDFNDVIFTVSDNDAQLETVSIDLTNMVQFETENPS
jgi:hypothetical protein